MQDQHGDQCDRRDDQADLQDGEADAFFSIFTTHTVSSEADPLRQKTARAGMSGHGPLLSVGTDRGAVIIS